MSNTGAAKTYSLEQDWPDDMTPGAVEQMPAHSITLAANHVRVSVTPADRVAVERRGRS